MNEKLTLFFGKTNPELSNFHVAPFEIGGTVYNSSEHYFMYQKAKLFDPDGDAIKKMGNDLTPNQVKKLGRQVKNFDRDDIIADMQSIKSAIQDLERQIVIERDKCFLVTEEQIILSLTKLVNGDIHDLTYRRSLIRIFINKIFIYDDKITITFKTGDEEVEITRELLDKIEGGLGNETLCFSGTSVHQ